MPKTCEFFFDLGSPASYLAHTQLAAIAARTGADMRYRPMLLGGVFKATGNASPVMVPAKGAYFGKDMARYAARYGVPFTIPPGFPLNTLAFMRICAGFEGSEKMLRFVNAIYTAMFAHGENLADPATLGRVLDEAGFDPQQIHALAEDQIAKDRLKATTEEAVARGVFGAPTFFVAGEMYFGQDRLDWVERALGR